MKQFLALLVVCLLIPVAAVAQDEDGGGFLTRTIEGALSGAGREVNIVGFEGALSSEATFDQMTIADDQGIWLTLEEVSLVWSRLALLRGRLEVESLTAQSLQLARLPETEDTVELPAAEATEFSFQLPELPVTINIDRFEVAEIDLGAPIIGVATRLSLNASARLNDDGLAVDLAAERIDDVAGRFEVRANVARDGAEIDLNLTLDEAPGGIAAQLMNLPDRPSVNLVVAGVGPLDDFTADINMSTDGQQRLAGQVSLLAEANVDDALGPDRRIRADLGGDITALIASDYQDFFGPDVGLQVNTLLEAGGAVDVESFNLSARAVDLAGTVRLNADLWPSFIDIEGDISQDDGTPVLLPGSDAGVTVQAMTLAVNFDATEGDAFRGVFDITDVTHEAVRIERTALTLDGILQGDVGGVGRFVTDLAFEARGLALSDETVGQALGESLSGAANIRYVTDEPIEISDLTLSGPDYGLDGDVVIEGFENGFPTQLRLAVAAQDLSRFAALAGQPLAGSADLEVAGNVTPLAGMFDLVIEGTTQDIKLEIPQADALLTGQTALSLVAARNEAGTSVRDLILKNNALEMTADATLRSQGSDVEAAIRLSDIGLVLPDYKGPVELNASAQQTEQGWEVDARASAPYDSRAVVSGLATGPDADITFDIVVPELQPIQPSLRGSLLAQGRLWQSTQGYRVDVTAEGPFDGKVAVEGLATGPDAQVSFTASLPDVRVFVPELGGPLTLEGEVARAGDLWQLDTDIDGPSGMTAVVGGTAAQDASTVDMKIVGQAPLGLSAPFLAPRSLVGPVNFDLALRGAPSLDALSGQITTQGARFTAPNLFLGLNGLNTVVDVNGSALAIDVGANIAAGGRLGVSGSLNIASLAADLAITLRDAVLTDPRIYSATLDGDVDIVGPIAGGARISGTINLDEVNVTVPGTGVTSIGEIPDINHLGARSTARQTHRKAGAVVKKAEPGTQNAARPYPLAVDIIAPSQIFVRGRGINAELGGALEITGDTNNVISAGSFDLIRGSLDIIGKRFELDEGSIQFQGNVTPYVRFVTTTQIPGGTASIIVDGLATEPEISFTSVPEAAQDEVLALIIFGRSVSQLSAFQALQLASGLAELSGRGGGIGVIGGLREGAGLDQLDVSTDETGATSVTAGKYITDDIYTDVTTSAQAGTDISLNIDLTQDLKAKATVGSEGQSRLGLFFERDY